MSHLVFFSRFNFIIWNICFWVSVPIQLIIGRVLYKAYMHMYDRLNAESESEIKICCCGSYRTTLAAAYHINNAEAIFLLALSVIRTDWKLGGKVKQRSLLVVDTSFYTKNDRFTTLVT